MGGPAVRLRHRLVDRTVLFVQGEFHTFIADPHIRKPVAPLGYTAGFLVVVLGRQQLFTENAGADSSLLHHRDRKTFLSVLRLWAVVLVANIAGTWAVAFAFAHYHSFEPAVELLCGDR